MQPDNLLKTRIEQALKEGARDFGPDEIDALAETVNIHHQELEYQNSELRRIHAELEDSRQRYLSLFNDAPVGYLVCDHKMMVLAANHTFRKLLNLQTCEGQPFHHFIHPDSQDAFYLFCRHQLVDFESGFLELFLVNGEKKIPVRMDLNKLGTPEEVEFRIAITDLSAMKAEQKAHLESELRNRLLTELTLEGILIHRNGKPRDMNVALTKLFGQTKELLLQRNFLEFVHPDDLDLVLSNLKLDYAPPYEIRMVRDDNTSFYAEIEARNFIENEEVWRVSAIRDISGHKAMIEVITQAKELAEESERLKSAFLANMSHEIRTPMNGILGFTELLQNDNLGHDEKEHYIKIIRKSGQRMLDTVNDLIDISRISTGDMPIVMSEFFLDEMLESLFQFFRPLAQEKGIGLELDVNPALQSAIVSTDHNKLTSILTNLLKNAIKFTDYGTVKISVNQSGESINFSVKDTGAGIPADRLEAVFNRFVQADIMDPKAKQGSGLGLTIARAYAEMLGGAIKATSEVGSGSEFVFAMPASIMLSATSEITPELLEPSANDTPPQALNILVAEDDDISYLFLETILEPLGQVYRAGNGLEAVAITRQNPALDLILMDVKMPGINGHQATMQIREFNQNIIIIAQSAYALAGDMEPALEAGCNGYITKPIRKHDLYDLINSLTGISHPNSELS